MARKEDTDRREKQVSLVQFANRSTESEIINRDSPTGVSILHEVFQATVEIAEGTNAKEELTQRGYDVQHEQDNIYTIKKENTN